MLKDHWIGIIIIFAMIVIALSGGSKKAGPESRIGNQLGGQPSLITGSHTDTSSQKSSEVENKNVSKYKGLISIAYVNHNTDPTQEYITLRVSGNAKEALPLTGWSLASLNTGTTVSIPQGVYLIFTGTINSRENISVSSGDTIYISSGRSPIGENFKLNKCSGYLGKEQIFVPALYTNCPLPKDENLNSIQKNPLNDKCFDYLDSYPSCTIQKDQPPAGLSSECRDFIYSKINYGSCINAHKSDKDFYLHEWRVYLNRTDSIWKTSREEIVLYDVDGKIVDSYKY